MCLNCIKQWPQVSHDICPLELFHFSAWLQGLAAPQLYHINSCFRLKHPTVSLPFLCLSHKCKFHHLWCGVNSVFLCIFFSTYSGYFTAASLKISFACLCFSSFSHSRDRGMWSDVVLKTIFPLVSATSEVRIRWDLCNEKRSMTETSDRVRMKHSVFWQTHFRWAQFKMIRLRLSETDRADRG